jgi:hypothetical protein
MEYLTSTTESLLPTKLLNSGKLQNKGRNWGPYEKLPAHTLVYHKFLMAGS